MKRLRHKLCYYRGLFDREIYNIVSVNASVAEILEVIRSKVPDLKTDFVDAKIMNQLSYNVSNAKFRTKGFTFTSGLTQGIHETIDLLKNARFGCSFAHKA